jgi:hypothetical protein
MQIFARKPEEAEADGSMRVGNPARIQIKSLAFVFDTMQEGMKLLRQWGLLKEDKSKDPVKNPSLEFNLKGKTVIEVFQKVEGMLIYLQWMRRLTFVKVGKGEWRMRYLAAQGEECRKRGNAQDELGKDLKEAGLRSVIQWLLWVFGLLETYTTRQGLLSQVPAFVRPKVLKALIEQACFGKEYDFK